MIFFVVLRLISELIPLSASALSRGFSENLQHLKGRAGISLTKNPKTSPPKPIKIHHKCSTISSETTLSGSPPKVTIITCTTIVVIMMKRNIQLLKKPLNTFNSLDFSFLQLISLKTCIKTKVLKKIVKR